MRDDLILETREGFFRGGGVLLLAFLVCAVPGIFGLVYLVDEGDPMPLAVCVAAFMLSVVRFPRRTLTMFPERLEISSVFGTRVIPFDRILGLAASRFAGAETDWASVSILRTDLGAVPLYHYEDGEELWQIVFDHVLPQVAARHLRELDQRGAVDLVGMKLDREGFTIGGGQYYWQDFDGAAFGRDGLLVTIKDRPHEAHTVKPHSCPEIPVFLHVWAKMMERLQEQGELERERSGRRRGRQDRPLRGLPPWHAELGELVFTRRLPWRSHVMNWWLILSGALLALGVGACVVNPTDVGEPEALAAPGGLLFFLGLILYGVLEPPGGDEFTVYEGGMASRDRVLSWEDCNTLTLVATEHYTNGVYQYTVYSAEAGGEGVQFDVSGFGPQIQAYYVWFRDKLSPMLADRDLSRLEEGEPVDYDFAAVSDQGIQFSGQTLGWEDYYGHSVDQGVVHVFNEQEDQSVLDVELSQPNAHVFLLILQLYEAYMQELAEQAMAESEDDKKEPRDSGSQEEPVE